MIRVFGSIIAQSKTYSKSKLFCVFRYVGVLNDNVISLCIYSDGLLQPRDLQLGATNAYSFEFLSLLHQLFAFRDLLFTVIIHGLVKSSS